MYTISLLRVIDKNNTIDKLTTDEKINLQKKDFEDKFIIVDYVNDAYQIVDNFEYFHYSLVTKNNCINIKFIDDSEDYLENIVRQLLIRVQKEILNPMETAFLYQEIFEFTDIRQNDFSKKISKTQGAISNKLRLLKLPIFIQIEIFKGTITERHGRAILQLMGKPFYEKISKVLLAKILKFNWNVSRLEKEINIYLNKPTIEELRINIKELKSKRSISDHKNILAINDLENSIKKSVAQIKEFDDKLEIEEISGVSKGDYIFLVRLKDIN